MLFITYLMILAGFSKTIVNESLFNYYWTKIVIIAILLYLLKTLLQEKSWLNKGFDYQNISKYKRFLSIIVGVPLLLTLLLERGIPIFLHHLFSKPSKKIVSIEKKIDWHSLYCNHGVVLKDYDSFNGRVCGLKEDVFHKVSSGDKIILYGNSSIFGFDYDKYTMLKDNTKSQ